MAITVEFPAYGEAVLDDNQWTHADTEVQRMLNQWQGLIPISGSDPYPALTYAEGVADALGGAVVKFDPIRPKKDVIY